MIAATNRTFRAGRHAAEMPRQPRVQPLLHEDYLADPVLPHTRRRGTVETGGECLDWAELNESRAITRHLSIFKGLSILDAYMDTETHICLYINILATASADRHFALFTISTSNTWQVSPMCVARAGGCERLADELLSGNRLL